MKSLLRLAVVVAMLGGAGLFLRARDRGESLPSHQELAGFPKQVAGWSGEDVPLDPDTREVLGDGEFLLRIYRLPGQPYVDYFVAYFATQRTGSTLHSPQNCLPGSGWAPVDFARIELPLAADRRVTVNRYVISKGLEQQLVLYWYQSNGRVVASEYWAKIFLVTDSIRRNRSDGALVRIVTPIARGETAQDAERRALRFATAVTPQLDSYVPR